MHCVVPYYLSEHTGCVASNCSTNFKLEYEEKDGGIVVGGIVL